MSVGLNIGRLVRVSVNLAQLAAARMGFGVLLIPGDSEVIDVSERLRFYSDIGSVAADFGTTASEYLAAVLWFGQSPRPNTLGIGRWARTASKGLLKGGIFGSASQSALLTTLQGISNGAFSVTIDGVANNATLMDFTAETNLNGVADVISTEIGGGFAICTWDGSRFVLTSTTTGATSIVLAATTEGSGTDVSATLLLTAATGATSVNGIDAETALEAVTILADRSGDWYWLHFAASTQPTDNDLVDVAAFIEAASPSRVLAITTQNTAVLDAGVTSDIASRTKALTYARTLVQYSSSSAFAAVSLVARAATVNFAAANATMTLMFKVEPGVVAEVLTETQAQTLKAKRCNVFAAYRNDTAIIQYGMMSGVAYIDERHGSDWFGNAIQTDLWNLLFTSQRKVPQTNAGQNQLVAVCNAVCAEAVINGLLAPGTWNADGFGQLSRGDRLSSGFYVFTQSVDTQAQSTREQRIAPPIQIAAKFAGSFHEFDVIVDVNR